MKNSADALTKKNNKQINYLMIAKKYGKSSPTDFVVLLIAGFTKGKTLQQIKEFFNLL
jgi:hypothetical protein